MRRAWQVRVRQMKKPINIDICDFSPNFPKTDSFYFRVLQERFDVRLCDQPDFLLYGP
jgi:hypothetical protein